MCVSIYCNSFSNDFEESSRLSLLCHLVWWPRFVTSLSGLKFNLFINTSRLNSSNFVFSCGSQLKNFFVHL